MPPPSMSVNPRTIRVASLKAVFAVLLVFAVSFGLVKSMLAFSFDGGVLYEEIALDSDAADDSELFLRTVDALDLPDFKPQRDVSVGDAPVRNLSQPPATPPPISA